LSLSKEHGGRKRVHTSRKPERGVKNVKCLKTATEEKGGQCEMLNRHAVAKPRGHPHTKKKEKKRKKQKKKKKKTTTQH